MSGVDKTDIEETADTADDQTEKFTDHDKVGEEKSKHTSKDIAEGMPEKDRENLKDTTDTK